MLTKICNPGTRERGYSGATAFDLRHSEVVPVMEEECGFLLKIGSKWFPMNWKDGAALSPQIPCRGNEG